MRKGEERMDELLRKRLEQFSAEPPERVWQGIRTGIGPAGARGKLVYIRWSAAAAVLLLALISGLLFIDRSGELQPSFSEQNRQTIENDVEPSVPSSPENSAGIAQIAKPEPGIHNDVLTVKIDQVIIDADSDRQQITLPVLKAIRSLLDYNAPAPGLQFAGNVETISADNLSEADKLILAGNLSRSSGGQNVGDAAWKVGVHVSPGVSSHTASYSSQYAGNMTYAEDDMQASIGGGFSVQYKAASRWRVETGMYYSKTGGSSGNSVQLNGIRADYSSLSSSAEKYFNTGVSLDDGQMAMNSTAGVIKFSRTPSNAELVSMPETTADRSTAMLTPGEFSQVFNYVEIPLFARYQLVDARFGVELMGGLSTNLIIGNNVYMDSNSGRELVGSTQDINTVNFSGTAGVGLIYALGKNLSMSVEPRLSYYLNSINHSGDVNFKPWRIGVFTGLSYEF
jgi:hypothetical protein